MPMFLKSGEDSAIKDPSLEEFENTLKNINNKKYCLSNDSRVGSIYSEHASLLLELKKVSKNQFRILVTEYSNENNSTYQTIAATVDLKTAVQIAFLYSNNDKKWRSLANWAEVPESILEVLKGFFYIVVVPSKRLIITKVISILLSASIILVSILLIIDAKKLILYLKDHYTLKWIALYLEFIFGIFGFMITK